MKPAYRRSISRRPLALDPLAVCLAVALSAPAAVVAASASNAPSHPAGTLAVTTCADAGPGSLRDALAVATAGGVIDATGLACGTITLASALSAGNGNLTIEGPGAATLAISGADSHRVLVHAGGGTLTLRGLTLTHGRADGNGGCLQANGELVLDDVIVADCVAGAATVENTQGGGALVAGHAVLTSTTFRDNRADGNLLVRGGAIATGGNLTATGSTFTGNTAHSHSVGGGTVMNNIAEGGGIRALGEARLVDSTVSGNTAHSDTFEVFGGGIAVGVRGSTGSTTAFTMQGGALSDNVASSDCPVCAPQGGGAWLRAHATVHNVDVLDNTVGSSSHYGGGGGLRFTGGGSVEILDSTISGNAAAAAGGGVFGPTSGILHIERTTISGNSAGNEGGTDEGGGGILISGGTLELVASSVTGNTAGSDGGGVAVRYGEYAPQDSLIINSTISGNTGDEGGGMLLDGGRFRFSNSTIAFNQGGFRGGGLSGTSATYLIDLQSTLVAGNTLNGNAANVWAFPKSIAGANNLVHGGVGPAPMPSDTITADPLLQPLADNGGPTPTHALGEGSPAIDAGNNAIGLVFDQRGANWMREHGAAADIGALEAQPSPDVIFSDGFED